jgi:hypothetical protein
LRILDDIDSLQRQIDRHVAVLDDPVLRRAPGRGFVAAEGVDPRRVDFPTAPRDASNVLTETGQFELEYHVQEARAAFKRNDPKAAAKILEHAAQRLGFDVNKLREHVRTRGGIDEINAQLRRKHEPAEAPPVEPEAGGPSSKLRRDPEQKALDELWAKLNAAHIDSPEALIYRVRRGGPKGEAAQRKINEQSRAPKDAELVNITPDELEAALQPKPANGRRQEGKLTRGALEINVYRSAVTEANPNPQVRFEATLPPWDGKPVVYQFGHGELRVWRSPGTTEHPHGEMKQETVVRKREERAGAEDFIYTHGEAGLAGSALERGHLHGAGLGVESGFGISYVPREVNQALQARGIEAYMRRLRDALPPGATLHYETTLVRHEGTNRAAEITYRIDISFLGKREEFAEFKIKIDSDPPGTPSAERLGTRSIEVEPLTWRDATTIERQRFLTHVRELVDVPQVLHHGLGRKAREGIDLTLALWERDPSTVAEAIANDPRLAAHPPPGRADFDVATWAKELRAKFSADPPPQYVVVDARALGLTQGQFDALMVAVDALPSALWLKTIVL